uniref:Uncharacterized protein n=1 Tax=Macrophomina phaseolina chrysovirus 2 TaxID=2741636 RepID=A0A7S6BC27_9VIRU|nr:hypothetical protein [Macrophomina phaseolina chrysovirus 2]
MRGITGSYLGLPFGNGVGAAVWLDSELKPAGNGKTENLQLDECANKWRRVITEAPEKPIADYFQLEGETHMYSLETIGDKHASSHMAAARGFWGGVHGHGDVGVTAWVATGTDGRSYIVDTTVNADFGLLRQNRPKTLRLLNYVIAGLHIAMIKDLYVLDLVVLGHSPIKQMKRGMIRSNMMCIRGTDEKALLMMPYQALLTESMTMIHKDMQVLTDVYHVTRGAVHYGRVAPHEVPPGNMVVLATNSGKSVTGSVLPLREERSSNIWLHATQATDGTVMHMLQNLPKKAPCIRDGLFSTTGVGALQGDGAGNLCMVIDGREHMVPTIVAPQHDRAYVSRDPAALLTGIVQTAQINGLSVRQGHGYVIITSREGREYSIAVRYGPSCLPRWAELLGRKLESNIRYDGSELMMDHGISGVARYILRAYTHHGYLHGCGKIEYPRNGPFKDLRQITKRGKNLLLTGDLPISTDYVVDFEFIQRHKGSEIESYVYAVGVAKFEAGVYMGSTCVMERRETLDAHLEQASGAEWQRSNITDLRRARVAEVSAEEIGGMVEDLAKMVTEGKVRVFSKGSDNDNMILTGTRIPGTSVFRRDKRASQVLREIGPLADHVEHVARIARWGTEHNPAKEAVLFAWAAGLCEDLPGEAMVGLFDWMILRPRHLGPTI